MNWRDRAELLLAWTEKNFRPLLIAAVLWLVAFLVLGPLVGLIPAANTSSSREFIGLLVIFALGIAIWRFYQHYKLGKGSINSPSEAQVASQTKRVLGASMLAMMVIGTFLFIYLIFL